jgi:hypothetical protein
VHKGSTTRVGAGRVQKSQGRRWDRPRQLRVHCSERCLAPEAPPYGQRHYQRYHRHQVNSTGRREPIVGLMWAEVKRGGTPGKLEMLTRGAQSEGLRQRRQSGVVDINGGLRQGVH